MKIGTYRLQFVSLISKVGYGLSGSFVSAILDEVLILFRIRRIHSCRRICLIAPRVRVLSPVRRIPCPVDFWGRQAPSLLTCPSAAVKSPRSFDSESSVFQNCRVKRGCPIGSSHCAARVFPNCSIGFAAAARRLLTVCLRAFCQFCSAVVPLVLPKLNCNRSPC